MSRARRFVAASTSRDRNEPDVIAWLERRGHLVEQLAGKDVPDLLVCIGGRIVLIEVKDGARVASERRLRPGQAEFRRRWTRKGAPVFVVQSTAELAAVVERVSA